MDFKVVNLLMLLFTVHSIFSLFLMKKVKKLGWKVSEKTLSFWGTVTIFSLLTLPLLQGSIIDGTFQYTTLIIITSLASVVALFAFFLSKRNQKKLEQLIFFTGAISLALIIFYSFKKFFSGPEANHSPYNITFEPYWVFLILVVFILLEKKFLFPHAKKSKLFYVTYAYIWFFIWALSFSLMITHSSFLSTAALLNFAAMVTIYFDFLLTKKSSIHQLVAK